VRVEALAIAPVKGMRMVAADALDLRPWGPAGDRAFVVVDADGLLVQTRRAPELLQVVPRWDPTGGVLELRLPGGETVAARPEPAEPATIVLYGGREVRGRPFGGPLAEALSGHLGRRVRLAALDAGQAASDDHPVTLMSTASLEALGSALGGSAPDPRRFRMTIAIGGAPPWAEDGWAGGELALGDAALRVLEPVPRCVVTTRDPAAGATDLPVLKALARLRGRDAVTFGVWCAVARPGRVRVGDPVTVLRARPPAPAALPA
jgi:uncharacterized protein